jgi:putative peptidoglycan lipid II flippase
VTTFYVLGLAAFSTQHLLIRVFYALKEATIPVKIAVAMVALNLPLNLTLVWFMDEAGLALSTTVCAALQASWLAWLLRRRLGLLGGWRIAASLGKTLIASAIMGGAVWLTRLCTIELWGYDLPGWVGRLGKTLGPVAVGGIVFYLMARLLRIAALRELFSRD